MMGEEAVVDWKRKAEALALRIPLEALERSVVLELDGVGDRSDRAIGVAFSGGGDSLALILLAYAHFPGLRGRMIVLHFDHRLRGEESSGDRRFVERVAEGLGLPIEVGFWEREVGVAVTEASARGARHSFFEEVMPEASAILFGHHRDDLVENMLIRISRGSGPEGLAGMRPVQRFRSRKVHLRPLLELSGRGIRERLEEVGVQGRLDRSNLGGDFYRNRIRAELIPLWEKIAPTEVGLGVLRSRRLIDEAEEVLGEWLDRELEVFDGEVIDLGRLRGKPRALWRRGLERWFREGPVVRPTASVVDELLEALWAGEGGRWQIDVRSFLEADRLGVVRKVFVEEREFRLERSYRLGLGSRLAFPWGRALSVESVVVDRVLREKILSGEVDPSSEAYCVARGRPVVVRGRRSGDRYRPIGMPGEKKISDLLIDKKIGRSERNRLPLVFFGEIVGWVPGFAPSEFVKVDFDTKEVVRLTYNGGGTV